MVVFVRCIKRLLSYWNSDFMFGGLYWLRQSPVRGWHAWKLGVAHTQGIRPPCLDLEMFAIEIPVKRRIL